MDIELKWVKKNTLMDTVYLLGLGLMPPPLQQSSTQREDVKNNGPSSGGGVGVRSPRMISKYFLQIKQTNKL